MQPKRLLFVCPNGHVFRSVAVMSSGRFRVCRECAGVTPDSRGRTNIAAARRLARPTKAGRECIQVFSDGEVKSYPKRKARA